MSNKRYYRKSSVFLISVPLWISNLQNFIIVKIDRIFQQNRGRIHDKLSHQWVRVTRVALCFRCQRWKRTRETSLRYDVTTFLEAVSMLGKPNVFRTVRSKFRSVYDAAPKRETLAVLSILAIETLAIRLAKFSSKIFSTFLSNLAKNVSLCIEIMRD